MKEHILVVDDDQAIRKILAFAFEDRGYQVSLADSALAMKNCIGQKKQDLVIMDVCLPDGDGLELIPDLCRRQPHLPVIAMSADTSFLTALRAMQCGVFDYFPKPFDIEAMSLACIRAIRNEKNRTGRAFDAEERKNPLPQKQIKTKAEEKNLRGEKNPEIMMGRSSAMQNVYRMLARLARKDLNVVISGESGTGKEVAARILHQHGKREKHPFIAVNMAALPRDLVETVLFGHEKGAFTGAIRQVAGKFEEARGGTLFLDEIGDMPVEAQTRLLRVLQEGEYMVVGGKMREMDCRIVAASNKNLKQLVEEGKFREDLYYRLTVVEINIPPLAKRKEDIPDLFRHFLEREAEKQGNKKKIDKKALALLQTWHWPGNVRELENCAKRIVALEAADFIDEQMVNAHLPRLDPSAPNKKKEGAQTLEKAVEEAITSLMTEGREGAIYKSVIEKVEKSLILRAQLEKNGNGLKMAAFLGLNRNTLRKKARLFGIKPEKPE